MITTYSSNSNNVFTATNIISKNDDMLTRKIFRSAPLNVLQKNIQCKLF